MDRPIRIAIGIVYRGKHILITRRRGDVHAPKLWEFASGKCRRNQPSETCVVREVKEATGLDVKVIARRPVIHFTYPDRQVMLHPFDCEWLAGYVQPLGCAECQWVSPCELIRYRFLLANALLLCELTASHDSLFSDFDV